MVLVIYEKMVTDTMNLRLSGRIPIIGMRISMNLIRWFARRGFEDMPQNYGQMQTIIEAANEVEVLTKTNRYVVTDPLPAHL
jgi:hypothetical protein